MRTDLLKRVQQLETAKAKTGIQITPGEKTAFQALRTYSKGERVTWERFVSDFPEISVNDKRIPYEGIWSLGSNHSDLTERYPATLECPPWRVSHLKAKEIHS